jgi:hypothetical protein
MVKRRQVQAQQKSMEKHVYCGKKYRQTYGSLLFSYVQMTENGKKYGYGYILRHSLNE